MSTASDQPGYKHKTLQNSTTIRLVQIVAGFPKDPIKCTSHTEIIAKLHKRGHLTAINGRSSNNRRLGYTVLSYARAPSYSWGPEYRDWNESKPREPISQKPERLITVDGKAFLVQDNLYRALSELRDALSRHTTLPIEKYFWIDVICINQSDASERNLQFNLLSYIYSEASNLVAWLGPEDDDSELAMSCITSPANANFASYDNAIKKSACTSLQHLCERSFWDRLWIFAEFILAKNVIVMCGSRYCSWSRFESYIKGLNQCLEMTPAFRAIQHMELIRQSEKTGPLRSLSTLLCLAHKHGLWERLEGHGFDCCNQLDRVYAWIPLAKGYKATLGVRKPDYSKSLRDLFFTILRSITKHGEFGSNDELIPALAKACKMSTGTLFVTILRYIREHDEVDSNEKLMSALEEASKTSTDALYLTILRYIMESNKLDSIDKLVPALEKGCKISTNDLYLTILRCITHNHEFDSNEELVPALERACKIPTGEL